MKRDIQKEVTDKIIEQMETCGNGWVSGYVRRACSGAGLPVNATTHNQYHGGNILTLGILSPFQSNEFASYKQWQSIDAQVIKGSKGFPVLYYGSGKSEDKKTGEETHYRFMRFSTVFNAEQVDGYTPAVIETTSTPDLTQRLANVDAYVAATGADVRENPHGQTAKCCYAGNGHIETLPRELYIHRGATATQRYYSSLLHELTHWTGHSKRLDRLATRSAEGGRAFEELIAELGSAIQCVELGVELEPNEFHAQYLNGWLEHLRNDKRYIFKAVARAQEAVNYLHELTAIKEAA